MFNISMLMIALTKTKMIFKANLNIFIVNDTNIKTRDKDE